MNKTTYTIGIYMFLILLFIFWAVSGIAAEPYNSHQNSSTGYSANACKDIQKLCDELIYEADKVIGLQHEAYFKLKSYSEQLDKDLIKTKNELYIARNPIWYKDPMWTGLAGLLGGVIIVLRSGR